MAYATGWLLLCVWLPGWSGPERAQTAQVKRYKLGWGMLANCAFHSRPDRGAQPLESWWPPSRSTHKKKRWEPGAISLRFAILLPHQRNPSRSEGCAEAAGSPLRHRPRAAASAPRRRRPCIASSPPVAALAQSPSTNAAGPWKRQGIPLGQIRHPLDLPLRDPK